MGLSKLKTKRRSSVAVGGSGGGGEMSRVCVEVSRFRAEDQVP